MNLGVLHVKGVQNYMKEAKAKQGMVNPNLVTT